MASITELLLMTQSTNYWTTAAAAAVAYDQALMFSQEVDFIWNRRWSVMTAFYFIARYSGSLCTIATAAWVLRLNWTLTGWIDIYLVVNWSGNIFILAMQVILLLRAYALCNQSKRVLVFLLVCFFCQAVAVMIMAGMIFNMRVMKQYVISVGPSIGSVEQITQVDPSAFTPSPQYSSFLLVSYDVLVFLFALFGFSRHVLEARRIDGGWSVNALVKLLVVDQMLYFMCFLGWLVLSLANDFTFDYQTLNIVVNIFNALAVIVGPRMVIGLRAYELKTRDSGPTFEEELDTIEFGARTWPRGQEDE